MNEDFTIEVKADDNDADYSIEISTISQMQLNEFHPLFCGLKKLTESITRHEYNWLGDDITEEELAKKLGVSMNLLDSFMSYMPYGEMPMHTIKSIYVYPSVEKTKIL